MEKRTREKLALVVFVVLVIFAVAVLTSYFSTGKSWTVAATAIDDQVGQLDGYTAIVYRGVAEPEKKSPDKDSKNDNLSEDEAIITGSNDSALGSKSVGLIISSFSSLLRQGGHKGLFVSDVRDVYESKRAGVLTIDLSAPQRYIEPVVLDSGNKRIGVFYADSYTGKQKLKSIIDSLELEDVDSVICLTQRPAMLASYEGIDVVVFLSDPSTYSIQPPDDVKTLITSSPKKGDIGVILFSNNNVPSFHSIDGAE